MIGLRNLKGGHIALTQEQIDGIVDTLTPIIPELYKELERLRKEKE